MITEYDYFWLTLATKVAQRSTCIRNQVGCIIIRDNIVLGAGFNSSPVNQKKCIDVGWCYRNKNDIESGTELEKCRASGSHAESNAICYAAKIGFSIDKATLYLVGHNNICTMCRAMIINSGIKRVVIRNLIKDIIEVTPIIDWKKHLIDKESK